MRVIPVLDLKAGLVVHGVAGERSRYQPIQSILVDSPEPLNVLQALHRKLGCDEYYVADLDAIQGQGNHYSIISRLCAEAGIKLLVDAGSTTVQQVQELLALGVVRVILGTETLPDWATARQILDVVSPERLVLSLDMHAGSVLSRAQELIVLTPLEVLHKAATAGFRSIIVLDLARVGVQQGLDIDLLARAHQTCPDLDLIAGGGVRHLADLTALQDAGMNCVLIATALHRGDITAQDIERMKDEG